jgi:hypothetical protein
MASDGRRRAEDLSDCSGDAFLAFVGDRSNPRPNVWFRAAIPWHQASGFEEPGGIGPGAR